MAGEGRVEIPLALLVNKLLLYALKHISSFFIISYGLPAFISPIYIYIFNSLSLNSHSGYTQLSRHY